MSPIRMVRLGDRHHHVDRSHPHVSDFCPTKPPSPLASPIPTPRLLDNPTMPSQPAHTPFTCTVTSPNNNVAPCTRSPTLLAKHSVNRHSLASPKPTPPLADAPITPPQPVTPPKPAPSSHVCDLPSNQRGHMTALKHRADKRAPTLHVYFHNFIRIFWYF